VGVRTVLTERLALAPPADGPVQRIDQGAIARFVASQGRGLHHVAVKSPDIDALLGSMAAAGLPMIDTRGRPGSRRALIGFPHPRALGGVLMHLVQRPD
jgi:methylmalonyl-CoA/ethylmalonyl-CoA epimerase